MKNCTSTLEVKLFTGYIKCMQGYRSDEMMFESYNKLSVFYLRPLLPAGDDESVSQRGVHGKDRPGVSPRHHPQQVVIPPHIHVSVNGSGKCQVILQTHSKKRSVVTEPY